MITVWKKSDCCKTLKRELRIFRFNFDDTIHKLREITDLTLVACQVDAGYGIYLLTGEYFTVSNSEGKTRNCLKQHKIFSRFLTAKRLFHFISHFSTI